MKKLILITLSLLLIVLIAGIYTMTLAKTETQKYKVLYASDNFEIRFYNPSFHKAKMAKHDWISGLACCFRRVNQRMHNKLLVVDDVVGLTPGARARRGRA